MKFLRSAMLGALLFTPHAYAFPLEVSDDRDGSFTIEKQPERVIALSNFAADLMVALGKEPLAVTTYEGKRPVYLGGSIDKALDLGDITAPNLELMAKLKPDLTVGLLRYNGPFEKQITAMGHFLAYHTADVEKSRQNVANLGTALGHAEETEALNRNFDRLRAEYAAKAKAHGKAPSYLFIWSFHDTFYAFQDNLMSAELLSDLGARNLVGHNDKVRLAEEAFKILDPEQLLALNPDYLLVFASHGGPIKANPIYQRLDAVKNGRAYSVGYQYSQPSGPIARELVIREGAHLLFPDLFKAPEMPDAARAKQLVFAE